MTTRKSGDHAQLEMGTITYNVTLKEDIGDGVWTVSLDNNTHHDTGLLAFHEERLTFPA